MLDKTYLIANFSRQMHGGTNMRISVRQNTLLKSGHLQNVEFSLISQGLWDIVFFPHFSLFTGNN